ncbi:hypothetical protein [Acidisoma cladoniae]|uniref:hypothetical protein n=1 Tax=Acidisoma cladoniae TaxID=3040935 RepID=UPI00254B6035|nr:hypothetical protein [Acidisoma sp. PAMC 29798]
MSERHYLEDEAFPRPQPQVAKPKTVDRLVEGTSVLGMIAFAVGATVVIMTLLGDPSRSAGVAAYFLNGNTVVLGRHSLDLSKPIFLRGSMPVCPDTDALVNFSPDNPNGCVMTQSTVPASLIAIVTDGMKQPSFQMQLGRGPSAMRGWVDYSNLTN